MKQITNKTLLKQGNKTYQPVEIDGVIYWVKKIGDSFNKEFGDWAYNPETPTPRRVFYRTTLEFLPHGNTVVAQSQPKLDGVPVVNLDSFMNYLYETVSVKNSTAKWAMALRNAVRFGFKSNTNQYTQEDIERAVDLAQEGFGERYTATEIIEELNSIQFIEVDGNFNFIGYK